VGIVVGCTTILLEKIFIKSIDFSVVIWYNRYVERGEMSTPYGRKGE
jgi:hypothetical protein